jgi:hypothetical protein
MSRSTAESVTQTGPRTWQTDSGEQSGASRRTSLTSRWIAPRSTDPARRATRQRESPTSRCQSAFSRRGPSRARRTTPLRQPIAAAEIPARRVPTAGSAARPNAAGRHSAGDVSRKRGCNGRSVCDDAMVGARGLLPPDRMRQARRAVTIHARESNQMPSARAWASSVRASRSSACSLDAESSCCSVLPTAAKPPTQSSAAATSGP